MKKALVNTNEIVTNYDGSLGLRIAETAVETFEVNPALFWVDCSDDCVSDTWYYDNETSSCVQKPNEPIPEVIEPTKEELLAHLEELTAKINSL